MNRRNTLKNLMVASGTLVALPSWAQGWTLGDITLDEIFTNGEQALLTSVADTIIPAGNSIGALSVGVDTFLNKLFAQCYETDVQENIKKQLNGLEASAKNEYGKSFPDCDQLQRQNILMARSISENEDESQFFSLIKRETIRGFSTSREVMVDYNDYKVAPGFYDGCADVNA
ncbi:MAG: gluconate 2-dehydrogenase subunit 3 family protein [Bacteroidetes bacterium]|nr:gluconate 2-dehydrogenase subunit 3 family protein [Bacteroidota bacterium]MDA1121788.1 gluconate 2-dehydrogenase subunit 3 family protein [Bacteroidota bacterium]